MKNQEKSRREVLVFLRDAGVALTASPFFLLSISTSPLEGSVGSLASELVPEGGGRSLRNEKVERQRVQLRVAHFSRRPAWAFMRCGVVSNRRPGGYAPLKTARGPTNEKGRCVFEVASSVIPEGRVYLRILTSSDADFRVDLRGTEAFEIVTSGGKIKRFVGTRERALVPDQEIVSCASCGYENTRS